MVASGRGRTVFLAGDDASGRDDLLRQWAENLGAARPKPLVLGGSFDGEDYRPWAADRASASATKQALDAALRAVKTGLSLGGLLLPPGIELLLGQLVSKVQAGADLVASAIAALDRPADLSVFAFALRELCRAGPAVCIISSVDEQPGPLWGELPWLLSRRIAHDLPLLLVLALDGPQTLGESHDQEPVPHRVARELTAVEVDVATWHWLAPLTADIVERWTGPVSPDVMSWLLEVTSGRSGETARRWRDWQQRGLVEDRSEGRWLFAAGHDPMLDMDGLLDGRTRRLCGGEVQELARIQRFLGCAALEGRRFTAEAVALAVQPGRDPAEIIDFLDSALVFDDAHPDGLVSKDTSALVPAGDGARELARYRFARELDWIALRHHGLSDGERRQKARGLVEAFEHLYGANVSARADTLARLSAIAGDSARARRYEKAAGINTDSRITLWRARSAISGADPTDLVGRHHVAQLLLHGAEELLSSGPFDEGVIFARAAQRVTDALDQRALAVYLTGLHLRSAGERGQARAELKRAEGLYRTLGGRAGLAGLAVTLHALAMLDSEQYEFDQARAGYAAVREIYRDLGDRHGEASVHAGLAGLDRDQGEVENARIGYATARAIFRELGDLSGEADTQRRLAELDNHAHQFDRARTRYIAARDVYRDLGDRHGEAHTQAGLADVDRAQDQLDRAREGYTAALEIHRDVGCRIGEAHARSGLARINRSDGQVDLARAGYMAAATISRELGNRRAEATARRWLAELDRDEGAVDSARKGFIAVSDMFREVGDRHGEAHVLEGLADLDRDQGHLNRARAGYAAALEIFCDVGCRTGEAHSRAGLANLNGDQEQD